MEREFIRLPEFGKCWRELALKEEDILDLETTLCLDPKAGELVRGTGGLRKLRWPLPYREKSGSIRVVYVDFAAHEKIYLITAYIKKDKDNLTVKERNEIKKLIGILGKELKRK